MMIEFSFVFYDEKSSFAFRESISKYIKNIGGIVTTLCSQNEYKVLVAIEDDLRLSVENFLKEKVAENILVCLKKDYIFSRLVFEMTPNTFMQMFLKTLVVFDSDNEKDIILERLNLKNYLNINSFFHFKLYFLKRKWQELINLANENIFYLASEESLSEFIKFLLSNIDYRCYTVNVFTKNNCYLLCDGAGNVITDFLLDKHIVYDENNLLTSLVALNPEKIILHTKSLLKDNLVKTLYEFFSNRIEISK